MAVYEQRVGQNDVVSNNICATGYFEGWKDHPYELAPKLTKGRRSAGPMPSAGDGARLLDVGAQIGYYSFFFAANGYNVIAVEPMTRNLEMIRATLCKNPDLASRIDLHPVALSSHETGHCDMFHRTLNFGNGMLACTEEQRRAMWRKFSDWVFREQVPLMTLNAVLSGVDRVDLVKMDVERSECAILEGGTDLLQKFQPRYMKIETDNTTKECVLAQVGLGYEETGHNGGDLFLARRSLT